MVWPLLQGAARNRVEDGRSRSYRSVSECRRDPRVTDFVGWDLGWEPAKQTNLPPLRSVVVVSAGLANW
jgi:hypothetical protein